MYNLSSKYFQMVKTKCNKISVIRFVNIYSSQLNFWINNSVCFNNNNPNEQLTCLIRSVLRHSVSHPVEHGLGINLLAKLLGNLPNLQLLKQFCLLFCGRFPFDSIVEELKQLNFSTRFFLLGFKFFKSDLQIECSSLSLNQFVSSISPVVKQLKQTWLMPRNKINAVL